MNCLRCKSHRTMKFVDGFDQKRIFCRSCGRSFLEDAHGAKMNIPHDDQKTVMGLNAGIYYRPGVLPINRW